MAVPDEAKRNLGIMQRLPRRSGLPRCAPRNDSFLVVATPRRGYRYLSSRLPFLEYEKNRSKNHDEPDNIIPFQILGDK
jgi:hypothetical protein